MSLSRYRIPLSFAALFLLACGDDPPPPADTLPSLTPPTEVDLERYDPQLYRPDEISLSGDWRFAFDPDDDGEARGLHEADGQAQLTETITVPFPWQSALSGLGAPPPLEYQSLGSEAETQSYNGAVWYAREVEVPADWPSDELILLRFGAVDWSATVWVDGVSVAFHEGGYAPFVANISALARPGDSVLVVVRAYDPCHHDDSVLIGKQGGIWYTCAGGIWQDVLLEHRPAVHLRSVFDAPLGEDRVFRSVLDIAGGPTEGTIRVSMSCVEAQCGQPCGPFDHEQAFVLDDGDDQVAIELTVDAPVWTAETPCLLGRAIEVRADEQVDTTLGYGAARAQRLDWLPEHSPDDTDDPNEQYQGFFVGDEPFYVRAVLDQAYHPESLISWPSRSFRVEELRRLRDEVGFNAVRLHIKPEEPYVYAACDVLGLWVIYDMPCPRDLAASGSDSPWRPSFEQAMVDAITRDRNHPSILWWVLFNEAWGLLSPPFWQRDEGIGWVTGMVERARALDWTRPIEGHSPGGFSEVMAGGALPHVATDVGSYHVYNESPSRFLRRLEQFSRDSYPGSQVNFFGPAVQEGQPLVISEFGPLAANDTEGDLFFGLHGLMNAMWRVPKIQGWVFTQWTDLEWENNGLFRYDREDKVTGLDALGLDIPDLFADPYLVVGLDPVVAAEPETTVLVDLGVGSSAPLGDVSIEIALLDLDGEVLDSTSKPIDVERRGFFPAGSYTIVTPFAVGIYTFEATLNRGEEVLARNGMYLVVDNGPEPSATAFSPGSCEGDCQLEVNVPTPGAGTYAISFTAEMASVDPRQRQTDGDALPSQVEIVIDGDVVGTVELADAPHDHRGVLSHLNGYEGGRGAYGELIELSLGEHEVGEQVTLALDASGNGVRVFPRETGRFLEGPRLVFEPTE